MKLQPPPGRPDIAGDGGEEGKRAVRVECAELVGDAGVTEDRGGLGRRVPLRHLPDLGGRNTRHLPGPLGRVLLVQQVLLQLVEPDHPLRHESLSYSPRGDDVVEQSQHESQIRMRLRGEPVVGLCAGRREAGIDHHEFRLGLLAAAKQIGERDRVCLSLVGAEEEEELARSQVLLPG